MSSCTGYTIQTHSLNTSCFHRVDLFVDMFENKSKSVKFLFCSFISVLLKSIAALFHTFCNSFMNTGFKFIYKYIVCLYFSSSADPHKLSAILNIRQNIHIHNKLYYVLRQKMIYEHWSN